MGTLLAALILWSAHSAWPKSKDDLDTSVTDPDIKKEMEGAEQNNLEAGFSRSMKDALKSAEYIEYILETAKTHAGASAQALSNYAQDFRAKAGVISLSLPKLDQNEYLMRRSSYRAGERSRDLKKAERLLSRLNNKRSRAASLGPAQAELLTIAQSSLGELRGAQDDANKEAEAFPQEKSQKRFEKLKTDIRDLGREIRLLEIALIMKRQDDISFDSK